MVVVGELVHGRHHRVGLHTAHMIFHCIKKCFPITPQAAVIAVTVLFHAGQEPCDRLHERIVIHDGVPLVAFQPGCRVTVMLCKNQHIRINLLHGLPEPAPERMVVFRGVAQVGCHIQTPSVNGIRRGHPLPCNIQYILYQLVGIFIIQLGQGIMPPPAVIGCVARPRLVPLVIKMEKAVVRAVLGFIGPRLIIP